MKKKLLFMFTLCLLLIGLAGCSEKEPAALRVCVDIGPGSGSSADVICANFSEHLCAMGKAYNGPTEIEWDIVPAFGTERKTTLERIRTEIMSGGGPDLFLVSNISEVTTGEDALFPIPEKAMQNGVFLPLDTYMAENTQFTDWSLQETAVMAAGKTKQGQLILPLTYTFPVTMFRADDVPNLPDKGTTWADMFSNSDLALRSAGAWSSAFSWDMPTSEENGFTYSLGIPVDYTNETILFTEDDLFERVHEVHELLDDAKNHTFDDAPDRLQFEMGVFFNGTDEYNDRHVIKNYDDLTFVPLYTTSGGAVASIVSYAAINSNSEHAEDAFFILDFLMSSSMQRTSNFYNELFLMSAIPMQTDLMLDSLPVNTTVQHWGLPEANFNALCDTREQLTNVQFRSSVTMELDKLYKKCEADWGDEATVRAHISETYAAIMRLISE